MSGALKNALDWASRPFPRRRAAAPSRPRSSERARDVFGAVWAQGELRNALNTIGAHVVDRELPVPFAHERFDDRGRLIDDLLRQELSDLLGELVVGAQRGHLAGADPIARGVMSPAPSMIARVVEAGRRRAASPRARSARRRPAAARLPRATRPLAIAAGLPESEASRLPAVGRASELAALAEAAAGDRARAAQIRAQPTAGLTPPWRRSPPARRFRSTIVGANSRGRAPRAGRGSGGLLRGLWQVAVQRRQVRARG